MASQNNNDKSSSEEILFRIKIVMLAGLFGIIFYALQAGSIIKLASIFSVGVMFAGACFLSGGLIGFLFGIPRTLQHDGQGNQSTATSSSENGNGANKSVAYLANTNLEQISDWLTKILVGVGLTQLTKIQEKVFNLAEFMTKGLGSFPSSHTFALVLLIFFLICGFLYGYLWARLFLASAFRDADVNIVKRKVKQSELDLAAINLVDRQLARSNDSREVTQPELDEAIKEASMSAKVQIFYKTHNIRSNNWKDNKLVMERTIPILRSLIASDTDEQFHQNHGQLGFALKDKETPNWTEAEQELSKAIEIRGNWKENGWLLYEFNRAICKIEQDNAFEAEQAASKEVQGKIMTDLKAAVANNRLKDAMSGENSIIYKWLQKNSLTIL